MRTQAQRFRNAFTHDLIRNRTAAALWCHVGGKRRRPAGAGGGAETAPRIVEGVAGAVLGGGLPVPEPEPQSDTGYHPELVNADCDLAPQTVDLLRPGAPRAVSFLLFGPLGASKSVWIRFKPHAPQL